MIPNDKKLRVGTWQTATGTLIAIIKVQRQNFYRGLQAPLISVQRKNICTQKHL